MFSLYEMILTWHLSLAVSYFVYVFINYQNLFIIDFQPSAKKSFNSLFYQLLPSLAGLRISSWLDFCPKTGISRCGCSHRWKLSWIWASSLKTCTGGMNHRDTQGRPRVSPTSLWARANQKQNLWTQKEKFITKAQSKEMVFCQPSLEAANSY